MKNITITNAPKAIDSNNNNSEKETKTIMNENKTAIDYNGIETAIEFAIEGINPLISEMNAAELVIALQKAAQRLAKENNIGSNELKATRAAYNAEKRAAVKAEKDATKAANKAAKASASKAEKDAAKHAEQLKNAELFRPFAEILKPSVADKNELKARCETAGISVAKARNAFNKVFPDAYKAVAIAAARKFEAMPWTEYEKGMKDVARYCKAHKLDLNQVAWIAHSTKDAAAPAAC